MEDGCLFKAKAVNEVDAERDRGRRRRRMRKRSSWSGVGPMSRGGLSSGP